MTRRGVLLLGLVALVAAATIAERVDSTESVGTSLDVAGIGFPVASEPGDLSSTWFCAGGTADDGAFADHTITLLNPTELPATVEITVFAGVVAPPATVADGVTETTEPAETVEIPTDPVRAEVELGPRRLSRVRLADLVTAPVASALVEAPTGGIVVEHEISSIHGFDAKPCVTRASDTWHFAWGNTERDSRELLVLFNPFPGDAVIDGRFTTEDGVREPSRFDGLVVPGESTVAIDLGDDVTRRARVSATLTARVGRVVADRVLRVNREGGPRGLTVQAGVPAPQLHWVFPDGFRSGEVGEFFAVYNPTDEVAEVEIAFALERPEQNGIPEPIELSLPPFGHAMVDLGADGRVPADVAHASVVRSENGVPVVAERIQSAGGARTGMTVTSGSPVQAETWLFASGGTDDRDLWLIVANPDPLVLAEVDVFAVVAGQLLPVSEMQGLVVEAGQRSAFRVSERIQRRNVPLLVISTEPVVAERGIYAAADGARGSSNAIGVPLPSGLRIADRPFELEPSIVEDFDLGDDGDSPLPPEDVELPEFDEPIDEPEDDIDGGQDPTTTAPADDDAGGQQDAEPDRVPDTRPDG